MNARTLVGDQQNVSFGSEQEEVERAIKVWLIDYLTDLFGLQKTEIDTSMALQRYGLDSSGAVALAGDLGNWIGCGIDPAVAYDYQSINELARGLSQISEVRDAYRRRVPTSGGSNE